MADSASTDRIDDFTFAKSVVDFARAHPAKAAAFGQAFVHAGIQLISDQLGNAETAVWLRKLAGLLEQITAREEFGNRLN